MEEGLKIEEKLVVLEIVEVVEAELFQDGNYAIYGNVIMLCEGPEEIALENWGFNK